MSTFAGPPVTKFENEKQDRAYEAEELAVVVEPATPTLWGVPLKYISLVTLAVQNAALAIIMHYSRISTSPERSYSAAAAVLMNELLKGGISFAIAFAGVNRSASAQYSPSSGTSCRCPRDVLLRFKKVGREVFSPDCWKLSIPAILYVIQNNLQYVAASNLDAATFQVTYQMKILTTAFFSVLLLRKRLSSAKWFALLLLAIGVATVQIQSGGHKADSIHALHPLKGFMAVTAACFTSGLAGVYFEMVLKGSQADLWVRNVQLSLFSLLPALAPIVLAAHRDGTGLAAFTHLFDNFGIWAWSTVAVQVFGGLVTALVIKYSDNILKGFATSLSIVLSSLASVALFNFHITFSFIVGSSIVLTATMLYSQPDGTSWSEGSWLPRRPSLARTSSTAAALANVARKVSLVSMPSLSSSPVSSGPPSPAEEHLPLFSYVDPEHDDKKDSVVGRNIKAVAVAFGVGSLSRTNSSSNIVEPVPLTHFEFRASTSLYPGNSAQRIPSRIHSQAPSRAHSPIPGGMASPPMFTRSASHLGTSSLSNVPL